jgi:hypothetical protein
MKLRLVRLAAGAVLLLLAAPAVANQLWVPIAAPCRVFDTRVVGTQTTGAPLAAPGTYHFRIQGECGGDIPNGVAGVSANVTISGATQFGDLRIYPEAQVPSGSDPSTINYPPGENLANGLILPLSPVTLPTDKDMKIIIAMIAPGTTHVIFDVNGFFIDLEAGNGLLSTPVGDDPAVLSIIDCADDEILQSNAGTWECATFGASGDVVTSVTGGVGIVEDTPTGDVTVDLETSYRLPQTCTEGQVAVWDDTNEEWDCATNPGGGAVVSKTNIYKVQSNDTIAAGATTTITVACSDANDVPLNGSCRPVPSNPSTDEFLVSFWESDNWSGTGAAAQFNCTYHNPAASASNNVQTRIWCITVP